MRHRNSVRQLGRSHSHRKAMYSNMVTSLFQHERIITTREKGKELKRISDRLITRAKKAIALPESDAASKLHNKREVMKVIKNRDVVKKLFEDIAPRYVTRNGGYTRHFLISKRAGDAAEMLILELIDKKVKGSKKAEEKPAKGKELKEKKVKEKDKKEKTK